MNKHFIFSILICHIPERNKQLKELKDSLITQCCNYMKSEGLWELPGEQYWAEHQNNFDNILHIEFEGKVQIVINTDSGVKHVGLKRNELLIEAEGDYCAFIDDDDLVSEDYISCIMEGLKQKPDCIGLEGIYTVEGKNPAKFTHSVRYTKWGNEGGVYLRNPNHLNPVKIEIARSVGFPEGKSFQEDQAYSKGLLGKVTTEVYIDHPIYFYLKTKHGYKKDS
jgi:hypothetical protein